MVIYLDLKNMVPSCTRLRFTAKMDWWARRNLLILFGKKARTDSNQTINIRWPNVFILLCNKLPVNYHTRKMLIRKTVYSFMTSVAKSVYAIIQSIMSSDTLYTSEMCPH